MALSSPVSRHLQNPFSHAFFWVKFPVLGETYFSDAPREGAMKSQQIQLPQKNATGKLCVTSAVTFTTADYQPFSFPQASVEGAVGSCISQGFLPAASFHLIHAHFSLLSNQKGYYT